MCIFIFRREKIRTNSDFFQHEKIYERYLLILSFIFYFYIG
ncbi:hypothetical protein RIEPE_0016 [Candidatus Riesia pediculicola USDA]|uniref:Uncharacterized protein n=1 Tax=Riesia pediculicola (strain USDA) TaxID=515618 RepID=D4G7H9_RIEPU|nr:hypothetical protein RIEPE_0005 [Candidatus Riesia pediculicola USDA]ADD79862.1 hypothetical protein RIEPE_0016 [Candidatus Riesia pediculicola USDA]